MAIFIFNIWMCWNIFKAADVQLTKLFSTLKDLNLPGQQYHNFLQTWSHIRLYQKSLTSFTSGNRVSTLFLFFVEPESNSNHSSKSHT